MYQIQNFQGITLAIDLELQMSECCLLLSIIPTAHVRTLKWEWREPRGAGRWCTVGMCFLAFEEDKDDQHKPSILVLQ